VYSEAFGKSHAESTGGFRLNAADSTTHLDHCQHCLK